MLQLIRPKAWLLRSITRVTIPRVLSILLLLLKRLRLWCRQRLLLHWLVRLCLLSFHRHMTSCRMLLQHLLLLLLHWHLLLLLLACRWSWWCLQAVLLRGPRGPGGRTRSPRGTRRDARGARRALLLLLRWWWSW